MELDSNNLYKYLYLNNPDMIFELDLNGQIVEVNSTALKVLGYSKEMLIGRKLEEYIDNPNMDFEKYLHLAINNEYNLIEVLFISKNRDLIDSIAKLFPISINEGVKGLFVIAEDLTARKKECSKSRYQERLFRIMADNSKDLIVVSNIEGEYLFVSPSSKKIIGYSPEELIGTYRQDYIPFNDYLEIKSYLDKTESEKTESEKTNTYNYRFKHKNESLVWLESTIALVKNSKTGEPIEFLTISRDITNRLETERILKESEKRHRILVEESPSSIIVYQNGKWVYINDTGAKLLGASKKDDIIGLKPHDFIHPDYHDLFRKQKRKVQQGKTVNFVEEKWIRLDGKVIDVEIKAIPFTFDSKPAIHIVINDISERKKMYELAQKAEKLFLVGQLAAGLAHEIRNPLTSIKGFLQLIKGDNSNNIYFDVMLSEVDRIDLITSELLLLAKPKFPPITFLNIKLLLEQVLALINTEAILHNIQLIKKYDNDPVWIEGNEDQIKQVFINIIKNALEATPDGGRVIIEVIKEENVTIRIIDNGCGIPEEKLKRIGEPFYTTKEKGTGLGMMVSFNIIENHRGKINVQSKVNKGTTFDVKLPIHKA